MANHLLLVGINNYLHHTQLFNCVKDVQDFKDILFDKFHFDELTLTELYDGNATNKNMQDALSSLARRVSHDDSLVIYFSGHGEVIDERGYWIPVEGTHHYSTWIESRTVITHIEKINCKHVFLVCDACFSNAFFNVGPTKGLKDYGAYKSRWALSSAFEYAYDSDGTAGNGPFARAILEFLANVKHDFRVGELIEFVKSEFAANNLQAPQGSALQCKGHMGGEMILQIKQPNDQRELRGYGDFLKALKLYKRKSEFVEIATFENKTSKVGFQLYQEVDPVVLKKTYFLYLYEGASQTKTLQLLHDRYNYVFRDKNLVVLLPREINAATSEVRLKNVVAKFKPISAFFIDKFISEQCTPEINFDRSDFLSISNFIQPSFTNHIPGNDYTSKWFREESRPILVVKGAGGIGKTTFAQFIADKWMSRSHKAHVVFIDSVQITDALLKVSRFAEALELYHFYEAFNEISGSSSEKLSEQVFSVNIDAGNILLIVDGLDEVISKIPNFNVEHFLKSIKDASKGLGGGKVVLTCRSHFWDASDIVESDLKVVELEPFNLNQAKEFFTKSLIHKAKVRRAIELADEFRYTGIESENAFHPYVLDVIRSIIGSEGDPVKIDLSSFASKLLSSSVKNDYIIYRVCDRERKRVGQISVDSQIRFFLHLATHKRGTVGLDQFRSSIEEALARSIDNSSAGTFKAHPFLKATDSSVSFKYDFLADLFKSIHLALSLEFEETNDSFDQTFIELVRENCRHGSAINHDAVIRIKKWGELEWIQISDFLGKLWSTENLDRERQRKVVGNLFSLCLEINSRFVGSNTADNTQLMRTLFEARIGNIKGLSIESIKHEHGIKFDFSGLIFTECYVNDYGSFWNCKFDSDTKFIRCHFMNLKSIGGNQILKREQFIDCTYDTDISEVFRRTEEKALDRTEQTIRFLADFFHLFYSGGRLGRQWEHKIIKPRFSGVSQNRFVYNEVMKILKNHGILEIADEKEGTKLAIQDKAKEDVVRFTKDGTMSTLINRLVIELAET